MLSAMAGVTWWNFYFRLFPGTIRSPQVIEFLSNLLRHIPGRLLIVWDGLTGHRSRLTWELWLAETPSVRAGERENLGCLPTLSAGETDRNNHSVAIQRRSES